jgi:hypothetical protein
MPRGALVFLCIVPFIYVFFFYFVSCAIGLTQFVALCRQDPTQFIDIGIITGIENNNKPVENARRGQEVCVKIENPGEGAPKMYGRHFFETDMLLSKVKCKTIDCLTLSMVIIS